MAINPSGTATLRRRLIHCMHEIGALYTEIQTIPPDDLPPIEVLERAGKLRGELNQALGLVSSLPFRPWKQRLVDHIIHFSKAVTLLAEIERCQRPRSLVHTSSWEAFRAETARALEALEQAVLELDGDKPGGPPGGPRSTRHRLIECCINHVHALNRAGDQAAQRHRLMELFEVFLSGMERHLPGCGARGDRPGLDSELKQSQKNICDQSPRRASMQEWDAVFAEGRRKYLETHPIFVREFLAAREAPGWDAPDPTSTDRVSRFGFGRPIYGHRKEVTGESMDGRTVVVLGTWREPIAGALNYRPYDRVWADRRIASVEPGEFITYPFGERRSLEAVLGGIDEGPAVLIILPQRQCAASTTLAFGESHVDGVWRDRSGPGLRRADPMAPRPNHYFYTRRHGIDIIDIKRMIEHFRLPQRDAAERIGSHKMCLSTSVQPELWQGWTRACQEQRRLEARIVGASAMELGTWEHRSGATSAYGLCGRWSLGDYGMMNARCENRRLRSPTPRDDRHWGFSLGDEFLLSAMKRMWLAGERLRRSSTRGAHGLLGRTARRDRRLVRAANTCPEPPIRGFEPSSGSCEDRACRKRRRCERAPLAQRGSSGPLVRVRVPRHRSVSIEAKGGVRGWDYEFSRGRRHPVGCEKEVFHG